MAWQGLKLNLRVTQKQILTPGLVQMVSVLALNRLELREMINQEMIANPVLEELSEEPTTTDNYSDENFLKTEVEKVPEKEAPNVFDEFDVGSCGREEDEDAGPRRAHSLGNRRGIGERRREDFVDREAHAIFGETALA